MSNKTKKMVAVVSLGLALGLGLATSGKVTRAQEIELLSSSYREIFTNYSLNDRLDLLLDLYNSGRIDWDEYNLYRDFLLSSDKSGAYDKLIDYYVRVGVLTPDQGRVRKLYGYGDFDYELLRRKVNTYGTYYDTYYYGDDGIELEIEY